MDRVGITLVNENPSRELPDCRCDKMLELGGAQQRCAAEHRQPLWTSLDRMIANE
jgi:hypothetical protein